MYPYHRCLTHASLLLFGLFGAAAPSLAADLFVPSKQYPTIQSAIDVAAPGDVICIAAGTYFPKTTLDNRGKSITLRGETDEAGRPITFLDGDHQIRVIQLGPARQGKRKRETSIKLEHLVIQHGEVQGNAMGGGIYNDECLLEMNNVHIRDNFSPGGGGGLVNSDSQRVQLFDCVLEENRSGNLSSSGGAGVYNVRCAVIELEGCHFLSNRLLNSDGAYGAGLYSDRCQLVLNDCLFKENSVQNDGDGGAGMALLSSDATLDACRFENNITTLQGGAIWHRGSELNLTNCHFKENYGALKSGEPITDEGPSIVNAVNCQFTHNTTGNRAGAIEHVRGQLNLTDCTFTENNAARIGGAIYAFECDVQFEGCAFTGNFTGEGAWIAQSFTEAKGGALYLDELHSGALINCAFDNNQAIGDAKNGYGGAIYIRRTAKLNLEQVRISGNHASNSEASADGGIDNPSGGEGYGGGIYSESSSPTLNDCTFRSNWASGSSNHSGYGGGMYNDFSSPNMSNCNFLSNQAVAGSGKSGYGGGMFNQGSDPELEDCYFRNNLATGGDKKDKTSSGFGGGIYNEASAPRFIACWIRSNRAAFRVNDPTERGGGIFNDAPSSATELHDSVVCGNLPDQIAGPYQPFGNNRIIESCPLTDINADGRVDGADLTILLGYWDTDHPCADLDDNGIVDGADLTILLGDWTG